MILRRHAGGDANLGDVAGTIGLGQFLGRLDQFVQRLGRAVDPGLFEKPLVVEQRQRTHGGRQRPIVVALAHGGDHREEVRLDLRGREASAGKGWISSAAT